MTLSCHMLRLLAELHCAPRATMPLASVTTGTAIALASRGLATVSADSVALTPLGRRHALACRRMALPRWLA